ncbi:MAG: hypothetical protein A3D92_19320 [Bacteroidetes bacterium RIFCSPHIGHO2_02_FULL_44_7]|nr:MAG: hypothetical protein A3D92_19320 [Bacteroidetes bacterium RIFCSPHIGHO2_02_FULL_44_7]
MWIGIGIGVVLILAIVLMHNALVARKNQVDNAFSSIDVYLKKRADQIPALIGAVKGYMQHEQGLLTEIAELRSQAARSELGSNERVDVENKITNTMGKIMLAVEAYPDLKAGEQFLMLQRSISEIEEQLAASRRAFNASVTDYNNGVESFPMNLVANMKGYQLKSVFTIPLESKAQYEQTPDIQL